MASVPLNFHDRIETSLNNEFLQVALDRNHERRIVGRNQRFAELPDAEAVRDRGRAIRIETLSQLDRYLEQFADNVEKNGGHVHWAATAEDARRIVLEIVCSASPSPSGRASRYASRGEGLVVAAQPLVAKSKSMISEEIHLNHALEAAGVQVVETDLGEWIVQLRGEAPAHIITPAVHLRREDVSALFHERFGMAPTLDVAAMTQLAQQQLREVYFSAEVGITGVNFGVAEAGAVAIVTNEGNADLSMTAPRVHIALMGLERMVPTLADLDVMLRLLPRSATAQKFTSYVSLVSGPRRGPSPTGEGEEPDGPEEFHVVLVDNGRSRTLGSELAESLLCIRCGACLNVCPIFREIGGHGYGAVYSGPIGSVVSPALFGSEFNELANASTLCGACQDICPVRIDIPTMLLAVRARHVKEGQPPAWLKAGMKAWALAMRSQALYESGQFFAGLGSGLIARDGHIRQLPPPLNAWTDRRDFPAFTKQSFRAWWRRRKANRGER
ncbi:MAG: lactate utilization protein B [Anaerolineales bacterium]